MRSPEPSPAASPSPPAGPRPAVVTLPATIAPGDVARLQAEIEALLLDGDVQVAVCDVARHPDADLRVVEILARLALTAGRLGRRIRVRHASREVREFLAFAGLDDVVPCEAGSVQARWQPEQREEPRGVQEEHDVGDAAPGRVELEDLQ